MMAPAGGGPLVGPRQSDCAKIGDRERNRNRSVAVTAIGVWRIVILSGRVRPTRRFGREELARNRISDPRDQRRAAQGRAWTASHFLARSGKSVKRPSTS